jgi:hypothetical protein
MMRTLGSAITPKVCVCTTLWRNLTAHIRIPGGYESILRSMVVLIASMSCQLEESSGWDILHAIHMRLCLLISKN